MHVYGDSVHCFACGFHGDVIDVWAAMRGLARPIEAALDLAREFSVQLPEMNPEVRQKAKERREKEDLYLEQARDCHSALSRYTHVTEWWEGRGFGESLRDRFLLGANDDGTSAVIPFWHRGRVAGLIRRNLEGRPKYLYPNVEEFTDGHRPLFIPGSVRGEIYLVEGIVDALAVAALGKSVVAIGGTHASEEQKNQLRRLSVERLYILPDIDEDGELAAREWARLLYPQAKICKADYGGADRKDFADLFAL